MVYFWIPEKMLNRCFIYIVQLAVHFSYNIFFKDSMNKQNCSKTLLYPWPSTFMFTKKTNHDLLLDQNHLLLWFCDHGCIGKMLPSICFLSCKFLFFLMLNSKPFKHFVIIWAKRLIILKIHMEHQCQKPYYVFKAGWPWLSNSFKVPFTLCINTAYIDILHQWMKYKQSLWIWLHLTKKVQI